MGDRVAVLREGGHLAQYATPAELLMAPADGFVEDFVGADRALKRLVAAAGRRHRPLGGAARLRRPGRPRRSAPSSTAPRSRTRSWSTRERRPLGWLSDADLRAETVPQRPDTAPEPVLERDDVMRDALSDLLQAETRYAPVVDGEGRIAGVLSVEIISEFLTSPEALERGASGRGGAAGVIRPRGRAGRALARAGGAGTSSASRQRRRIASPSNEPSASSWAADNSSTATSLRRSSTWCSSRSRSRSGS